MADVDLNAIREEWVGKVFQELEQLPEAKVGAPRRPSEDVLP